MSAADKDAEIAALRQQNATLQARVKELETGTARLSVRLSGERGTREGVGGRRRGAGCAHKLAKMGIRDPAGPLVGGPVVESLLTTHCRGARAEMGAAMLARPEPEQPAAAPAIDNSAVELIQGMLMAQSQTIAKFEKKMDDRTSNLESMAMQAAMNGAKQTSQTGASQQCSVPGPLRHPLHLCTPGFETSTAESSERDACDCQPSRFRAWRAWRWPVQPVLRSLRRT